MAHSLAGKLEWRRLTVTLAWPSSVNPRHRDYRRAQLWFGVNHTPLKVSSAGADWKAARRGTIQHEVWSGERASAFAEGAALEIVVSCAGDAGELTEAIPYALCVSLEVGNEIAKFLSGANPHLPADTLRSLLTAHGAHHVQ